MTDRRSRVPRTARTGEVIEIKTLLSHPMETGHRRDVYGKLIPRQIIHTFTCTYNGTEVFRADWHPAVAANPYLAFFTVATESGRLRFEWIDDEGPGYATEAEITVAESAGGGGDGGEQGRAGDPPQLVEAQRLCMCSVPGPGYCRCW